MKFITLCLIIAVTSLLSCTSNEVQKEQDPDLAMDRFDEDVSSPVKPPPGSDASKSALTTTTTPKIDAKKLTPAERISMGPILKATPGQGLYTFRESFKQTVTDRTSELTGCYNDALKKQSLVRGRLVMDFEINDQGRADTALISKNDTSSQQLADCVLTITSKWPYPPAPKGQIVFVRYPLNFTNETK